MMRAPSASSATVRHALHYGQAQSPLVWVEPDSVYPNMWRVVWPDGRVSDMVNLARAKDAALVLCQRGPPARDDRLLHWRLNHLDSPSGARTRVLLAGPAHRPSAAPFPDCRPIFFSGAFQRQHRRRQA
jgi:hypothetical protein